MKYYVCYYHINTKKKWFLYKSINNKWQLIDLTFTVFSTRLHARIAKSRYFKTSHMPPETRDLKIYRLPIKGIFYPSIGPVP